MDIVNDFLNAADHRKDQAALVKQRQQNLDIQQAREQRAIETHAQQTQTRELGKEQLQMQLETMSNKLDTYYTAEFDRAISVAHDSKDLTLLKNLVRKDKTSELFGQISDVQLFENSPDADDLYTEVLGDTDTSNLTQEEKVKLARKVAPDAIIITRPNGDKELASISGLMTAFGYTNRQSKEEADNFTALASKRNLEGMYALAIHYGDKEKAKEYLKAIKALGSVKGGSSEQKRIHSFNYLDGQAMGEQQARQNGLVPGTQEFTDYVQKYTAEYIDYATGTSKTKDANKLSSSITSDNYMAQLAKNPNSPKFKYADKQILALNDTLTANGDLTVKELTDGLATADGKGLETAKLQSRLKELGFDENTKIKDVPSAELLIAIRDENPALFSSNKSEKEQFLSDPTAVLWAYKNNQKFSEAVNIQRNNIKATDKSAYDTLNRVAPQVIAMNSFDRIIDNLAQTKTKKNFLTGMSDWINSYAPTITDSTMEQILADGIDKKASEYANRIGLQSANTATVAAILKAQSGLTVSDKERQNILNMAGDFSSMSDVKKFVAASRGYVKELQAQLQDDLGLVSSKYPELASFTLANVEQGRLTRVKDRFEQPKVKAKKKKLDDMSMDEIMSDLASKF